ncbi:MAG: Fic/DOC family N-terminal domain-containing protein [Bacteroidota bacterium]
MSFDRTVPYNDLPGLPPDLGGMVSGMIPLVVSAHRSLAELKGYCQTLPNPELLLNAVVLHESKDSSEIENIVTTQDELFRAAAAEAVGARESIPAPAKEVLRYREAAYWGWTELQRTGLITTNTLKGIVQRLKDNDAGVRTKSVVIGKRSGDVVYTPPEGEGVLRDKLEKLEAFINDDRGAGADIDPLVKMALVHYQFEAIHPFYDGNGRTGRILNVLYLIQQGLLQSPVLYLSAYILGHRADYYRLLRAVTEEEDWASWVRYMLEGVRATSQATLDLIRGVNDLIETTAETAKEGMKNGYSRDLVRLLFRQPYCKIQFILDEGLAASRATASRYLADLERIGVVESLQVHREKYFINYRLLDMLASFRP